MRTIARLGNELGWNFTTAKYCQAIREANKQKQSDWCNQWIEEKEAFDNVIFFDELMQLKRKEPHQDIEEHLVLSLLLTLYICYYPVLLIV